MFFEIITNKDYKDISPMRFGYEQCENGHFFGPATRFDWLFHFVVSGKGKFTINNKTYHLSSGMMFVIPPFVETYYQADENEPWEYIWVGFKGEPPLNLENVYNIPQALSVFESMKHSKELEKSRTEFILAKLWELFSILIEEKTSVLDPIEAALNIIHSEYMTDITIEKIAKKINLERTYFSNLFGKRVGCAPKQYLLKYRMEQALVLLKRGNSITTIAFSVGYQDVYVFSKMFKRYFGISPSNYLKNNEENL